MVGRPFGSLVPTAGLDEASAPREWIQYAAVVPAAAIISAPSATATRPVPFLLVLACCSRLSIGVASLGRRRRATGEPLSGANDSAVFGRVAIVTMRGDPRIPARDPHGGTGSATRTSCGPGTPASGSGGRAGSLSDGDKRARRPRRTGNPRPRGSGCRAH